MFDCWKARSRRAQLGYGSGPVVPSAPGGAPSAPASSLAWHVNPIINGVRYEPPAELPEWIDGSFEVPSTGPIGCILQRCTLPLSGTMRIDYELGGAIELLRGQEGIASMGLFFVSRRDRFWSGLAAYGENTTRWYSNAFLPITAGRHSAEVPLIFDQWGGPTIADQPLPTAADFAAALADAEWCGPIFGDGTGRAHSWQAAGRGVFFTLHSFSVG